MRPTALALIAVLLGPAVVFVTPLDVPTTGAEASRVIEEPWGLRRADFTFDTSRPWPVVFTMEGYSGAGEPNLYVRMADGVLIAVRVAFGDGPDGGYARMHASIRGTECSGGQFNLYDRVHAWDGHHLIEWAGTAAWSNGKVGMIGASFSGQTAFWTATTQPPHLAAVSANLLHSDIYRDIFMPGGVQNYLFPVVWTYGMGVSGPHRLPVTAAAEGTLARDAVCQANQLDRANPLSPPQPQLEPAWAATSPTDNQWYAAHAATTYAGLIKVPYYQQNNWHDEQTGARAAVLWHFVHPDPVVVTQADGAERVVVPKKLVTANGDHGWGDFFGRDQWAWWDVFLRGAPDTAGILDDRVVNYFEATENGTAAAVKKGDAWPFPDTRWQRFYFAGDGGLGRAPSALAAEPSRYVAGPPVDHAWSYYDLDGYRGFPDAEALPDHVSFTTEPFRRATALAGPIVADLYATLTGTDTDFFVAVEDVAPDGRVAYLQRGLLKASHAAVDDARSWFNDAGELVQPYRRHTNPQPVTPLEANHYAVEVFPLGHVFRPGHSLRVTVTTPPAVDGLWGYTPLLHQPGVVSILHDADHPSSLLVPVVPLKSLIGPATEPCGVPGGFPCRDPTPVRLG